MQNAQVISVPSVGLKALMAISGLLMALWLTLHMIGNLLVFGGPELMNGYALKLRATGLLWPMRIGLVALFVVHVVSAIVTSLRSHDARPTAYAQRLRWQTSSLASRTMRTGGILLALYVVYHVAHMYGVGHAHFIPGDVHHNLVSVLRSPLHAILYTLASLAVAFHLAHGLCSALRSLGVAGPQREQKVQRALSGWAWVVSLGFAAPALYYLLA